MMQLTSLSRFSTPSKVFERKPFVASSSVRDSLTLRFSSGDSDRQHVERCLFFNQYSIFSKEPISGRQDGIQLPDGWLYLKGNREDALAAFKRVTPTEVQTVTPNRPERMSYGLFDLHWGRTIDSSLKGMAMGHLLGLWTLTMPPVSEMTLSNVTGWYQGVSILRKQT